MESNQETMMLLWDRWLSHAERIPDRDAVVHYVAGEEPYRWTWAGLINRAIRYAAVLSSQGVRQGQVCALILRHHREFYPIYMAVEALGALPAVLAYPNPRLHVDKFRQGLEGMAQRSGLDWILTETALDPLVRPLALKPGTTVRQILFPLEWARTEPAMTSPALPPCPHPDLPPTAPCLLQHSSGTTGLQKPVVLSHHAVLEHVKRYGQAIGFNPDDRVCSWLPLYHDMGLIAAFHMPLAAGITTIQIDPFEWVTAPVLLLDAIASERATVAWLPNFAYNHMADRIHDEDLENLRLDSIRLLINCSEPVRAYSHERFRSRFAPIGLKPEVLSACYAMAETTFAVTQTQPGIPAPEIDADRAALARGQFAPANGQPSRRCVSSGHPIDGCQIRIVDPARASVADGIIGEIAIRSVSMFDGYRNNPEQTAKVLEAGWYYSGDFGFLADGEIYVIGRKKDIIIHAGKNLYPEDIEDAINSVPGVIPGRIVAFGAEDEQAGTEMICVVAETDAQSDDQRRALRLAIVEAAMRIDVTISRVYLAPPRWLIKSSAGKPSRSANRERAVVELQPVR